MAAQVTLTEPEVRAFSSADDVELLAVAAAMGVVRDPSAATAPALAGAR